MADISLGKKRMRNYNYMHANAQPQSFRPSANYLPPFWGHSYFASLPSNDAEFESCTKQIEELKIRVKEMLTDSTSNPVEIVRLIHLLCRLGLSYHFESEIEDHLQQYFDHTMAKLVEINNYNLEKVALVFRVFRQYGYKVSCDVFNMYKENSTGEFKESLVNDVKGMLSLYEAAHLRMHGEAILDEALAYTTTFLLKLVANQSDDRLAKHIQYALVYPFHKSSERLAVRQYIDSYEEDESCNEMLLKFAKLDFNRLQLLHRKELTHVARWYKEIDFTSNFGYARERIAENHLWLLGTHFEPQYTKSRIFVNKVITLATVLDDIYDVYGSIEEVRLLTDAIQRWEIGAIDQLPDYMKMIYSTMLDIYHGFENELKNEARSHLVSYAKDAMKELVRGYHLEAEWFHRRCVPPFDEYMETGLITITFRALLAPSFLGIDSVGADAFEWLKNSKILRASQAIGRLMNDTATRKVEQKLGHSASSLQCYMNENGVSEEEAIKYIREEVIESAWKDINEEQMRPNIVVPRELLMLVVNLARVAHSFYNVNDVYTNTTYSKEHVKTTFVEPYPI
ncbi:probable terpene synthase 6 [Tripterygium wilfordii]|uniref:probable terpene synthase 6 n=1 Tax=Tripterygium wilfordii TaxID=458696 RepID=UPI0018F83281|nr:probable terpene synthase 6 [Tripterygium wilfordii]XP_038698076.1 probable terpene synthase 6 [Tripterygium wilfordii]